MVAVAAGRLTGTWTPNYDYVSFGYDAGGRLIEKWFTNGVDARYSYNADNTLASLVNKNGSSTISNHVYTYDALANRQTQAETVNGTTLNYTYGYDQLNRLTQVQNGTVAQQQNYTFDPIGNRLTKKIGSTTTAYVHDAANQLKEVRNGTPTGTVLATLTYDANGNLKTRSDTSQTFIYDALNRLAQVTQTGQSTQSYQYDDEGRRVSKSVGSTTTNFLYNGPNLIAEYASTWGSPTAQYAYGPMIDNVIEKITSTTSQYFHQDGLNSVMAVTNNLGTTDATQRFDAWGNKIASTGTSPRNGYTGREPDETGLINYRARYYDPGLARFTQRDPIGLAGGLNRFGYVDGNPINHVDPSGLDALVITGGIRDGSWNPFGHIGMAVTGNGMYSYGNNTDQGSSPLDYIISQSQFRDQQITIIPTSPTQDSEMMAYFATHPDNNDVGYFDNCAVRTNEALESARVPVDGIPFPGGTARDVQSLPGTMTFYIPKGGDIPKALSDALGSFGRSSGGGYTVGAMPGPVSLSSSEE